MTVMIAASIDDTLDHELPAAAAGCQHAYGRIVQACQNTITAIALAITGDRAASEDIAQEAFVRGWQQLHQLRSPSSFLPWLRQITRNLARDWLRAQRGRPMSGEAAELAISMAADPAPDSLDRLARLEEEVAAEDIISSLPADSREVLLLYYREGQRSQQVAALLQWQRRPGRERSGGSVQPLLHLTGVHQFMAVGHLAVGRVDDLDGHCGSPSDRHPV